MKRIVTLGLAILMLFAVGCNRKTVGGESSGKGQVVKKDKEYVYNWLQENGRLEDGSNLVYTSERADGSKLKVTATAEKELAASYNFKNEQGLEVTCEVPLFPSKEKYELCCTILNENQTGVSKTFQFYPAKFTSKSPLLNENIGWVYLEGDINQSVDMENGVPKVYYYSAAQKKSVAKTVPSEVYQQMVNISDNFSEPAQAALCKTLNVLQTDFCAVAGTSTQDLGYKEFKVSE